LGQQLICVKRGIPLGEIGDCRDQPAVGEMVA
jgi:hypothetical protein